jgi:hypothetical protein
LKIKIKLGKKLDYKSIKRNGIDYQNIKNKKWKVQNPKIMEAIVLYVTKTLMKLNKPEIRLACQCHCLVAMSFVPVAGKGFYPKK